jgi:hypothetical protein
MSGFELTITTYNDASSGLHDTFLEARAAADEAAAVDDLTVDVQRWTKVGANFVGAEGTFVDNDGMPWFEFTIRKFVRDQS